jgi:hypothetical protein
LLLLLIMSALLSLCTKEDLCLVIQFLWLAVYCGLQSIGHFQHNMGTVFCHNRVSTDILKN